MVVAGPGSGKTRVISYRAVHLVREMGVDPPEIMAVTFTRNGRGGDEGTCEVVARVG